MNVLAKKAGRRKTLGGFVANQKSPMFMATTTTQSDLVFSIK
jgi:hypothetical protein